MIKSPATIISKRPVFCRELIGECLTTHDALNSDDIKFALQLNCDLLSDQQLAIIIVHLCKTTDIGKFSLLYNYNIDMAIKSRDLSWLMRLLQVDDQMAFPELYRQKSVFTIKEQDAIYRTHTREYNAAFQLVKTGDKITPPYSQYLIKSCPVYQKDTSKVLSSSFHDGVVKSDGRTKVSLYQTCLEGVCIAEKTPSNINFTSLSTDDTDMIMVPSRESNGLAKVQCFNIIDLTKAVSTDPAVNPTTGKPFDLAVLQMIRNRLAKEIKLYRYFLANVNK
uniref:Uncharacterized protein n=1 Tax=Pithovirus LCPAC201 TaxID=2506591 RepID=A0A481Z6T5_9VIRU|nr:MAG: uncharacterized protein LCPAC201_01500 [Pithovirus LCPAC201]